MTNLLVCSPKPPISDAAIGTMISATSGDIRFDRIAASSTTIVPSPSNGSIRVSYLVFVGDERKVGAAIAQLK